jgi:hypothetical protein
VRKVPAGEPGLLISPVNRLSPFDGYTDPKASEKKLIRNAFKDGDVWFNTGDVMRPQGLGHAAFGDRLGDTFRWKGENVATTEVEAALAADPQVEESTVFGVERSRHRRPGRDGRVKVRDGAELRRHRTGRDALRPAAGYAIPLFIRVVDHLEATTTFKSRKVDLRDEGYGDTSRIRCSCWRAAARATCRITTPTPAGRRGRSAQGIGGAPLRGRFAQLHACAHRVARLNPVRAVDVPRQTGRRRPRPDHGDRQPHAGFVLRPRRDVHRRRRQGPCTGSSPRAPTSSTSAASRPGWAARSADEEIARVVPFIEWLRAEYPEQLISVDTWRPAWRAGLRGRRRPDQRHLGRRRPACRRWPPNSAPAWSARTPAARPAHPSVPGELRHHLTGVVDAVLADVCAAAERAVSRAWPGTRS